MHLHLLMIMAETNIYTYSQRKHVQESASHQASKLSTAPDGRGFLYCFSSHHRPFLATLYVYIGSHPKSIEEPEFTWALLVADHSFAPKPSNATKSVQKEGPARQRTLSLGHGAARAPSDAGTVILTNGRRSCMFAAAEELGSGSSGFKRARKRRTAPFRNYLSAFYIP